MNLSGLAVFLVFGLLLLSIDGSSLTVPSNKNRPEVPEEIIEMMQPAVSSGQAAGPVAAPTKPGRTSTEDDKPPIVISVGDLAQIKKKVLPLRDDGNLVGEAIGIYVEVLCRQNLNEMHIKEFVENGLEIINTSDDCYRLVSAKEISAYEGGLNRQYFNDNNPIDGFGEYEKGIHEIDRNPIEWKGSRCIFNLKNDHYYDNLTSVLKDDIGISWAKNASASFNQRENAIIISNKTNQSDNISIYLDKEKKCGILHAKNLTYRLLVNCESYTCPSGEPVDMRQRCNVTGQYAKERIMNLSICTLNNDFDIVLKDVRANERYAYWYYVKADEPRVFASSTILFSSFDGARDVPDVESSVPIKASKPRPNVNIRLNKVHMLRNEPFDITYEIEYSRYPGSDRSIDCCFPPRHNYFSFLNKDGDPEDNHCPMPLQLGEDNKATLNKTLKYLDIGEFYLPVINIDGEDFPFQYEKIYVESRFERYVQFVTLLMGVITFIFRDPIMDLIFPSEGAKEAPLTLGRKTTKRPILNEKNKRKISALLVASPFIIIILWFLLDRPLFWPFI